MSVAKVDFHRVAKAIDSSWGVVALAALIVLFFDGSLQGAVAHRIVDDDEGYLLLAAWRCVHGLVPYRDFHYPQIPLQPYVYGLWLRGFGYSLRAGRELSAFLTSLTAAFAFLAARRLSGRTVLGLLVVLLFGLAVDVREWLVLTKTFPLGLTLAVAGFWALTVLETRSTAAWACATGLLVAGATSARATFAPLLLIFALAVLLAGVERQRWRLLAWYAAGCAVLLVPLAIFACTTLRPFLWDNWGAHLVPLGATADARFLNRLREAKAAFGLDALHFIHNDTEGAQRLVLLVPFLTLALLCVRRRPHLIDLVVVASILSALITAWVLYPAYSQYYVLAEPWLLFPLILVPIRLALGRRETVALLLALALPFGVAYLSPGGRTSRWDEKQRDPLFAPSDVLAPREALARRISRVVPRGALALTNRPLDLVGTDLVPVPASIVNSGIVKGAGLTLADRAAYGTMNDADASSSLADRSPVAVLADDVGEGLSARLLAQAAIAAHYRLVLTEGGLRVYLREPVTRR